MLKSQISWFQNDYFCSFQKYAKKSSQKYAVFRKLLEMKLIISRKRWKKRGVVWRIWVPSYKKLARCRGRRHQKRHCRRGRCSHSCSALRARCDPLGHIFCAERWLAITIGGTDFVLRPSGSSNKMRRVHSAPFFWKSQNWNLSGTLRAPKKYEVNSYV